jgi:hypothetical protein
MAIKELPSEYFHNQIYTLSSTRQSYPVVVGPRQLHAVQRLPARQLETWPNSRQVVGRDLGNLSTGVRAKLVRENVARLYHIPVPSPIQ